MKLSETQINKFIFTAQCFGVIFMGIFIAAYFGGLPSTATLNSEPIIRMSQSLFGGIFIAFLLISLLFAGIIERKN